MLEGNMLKCLDQPFEVLAWMDGPDGEYVLIGKIVAASNRRDSGWLRWLIRTGHPVWDDTNLAWIDAEALDQISPCGF